VSNKKDTTMFRLLTLLFTGMLFFTCADDQVSPPASCSIPATVVDLSGLDGCGFAFELQDGTKLLPIIAFHCGTPPLPQNSPSDPIHEFDFVAGKKVFIEYTTSELYAGACMAGEYVSITCITETPQAQTDL
jgi:hypothetical protein